MKCAVHKACNHIRRRETWYWGGLHGNSAGDCVSNVWEDFETDSSGLRGDDNVKGGECWRGCICTPKIPLENNIWIPPLIFWLYHTWSLLWRVSCVLINSMCVLYRWNNIYILDDLKCNLGLFSRWWVCFSWTCCPTQHRVQTSKQKKFLQTLHVPLHFAPDWAFCHRHRSVICPLLAHRTEEINVCLNVLHSVEGLKWTLPEAWAALIRHHCKRTDHSQSRH